MWAGLAGRRFENFVLDPPASRRAGGCYANAVDYTFDADGTHAITASRDGVVRTWPVDPVAFADSLPMADLPEDERRRLGLTTEGEGR